MFGHSWKIELNFPKNLKLSSLTKTQLILQNMITPIVLLSNIIYVIITRVY